MKTVLVFSGYNQRAVFAFLRVLEQQQLDYAVIASSPEDSIFRSTYRSKVVTTRSTQALEINKIGELLSSVIADIDADSFLIAPSTEALNRFLLTHRAAIESLGIDVPLVDEQLYLAISDKRSFLDICGNAGIGVPETFEDIDKAALPFVAKPAHYVGESSGDVLKPVLVETPEQLTAFNDEQSGEDFFYQEYVEGHSYYLLYYFFRDGREPLVHSQENLVQQPGGESVLAAVSSDLHASPIAEQYRDLFLDLGYFGLVMVEVRGAGNSLQMIEANPRFWGPSQLFVDAGIKFFEAFLEDWGFDVAAEQTPRSREGITYFWDDGESFNDDRIDQTMFHNYSAAELADSYGDWDLHNLFKRPDTLEFYAEFTGRSDLARSFRLELLKRQYVETSKHSNYQVLAPQLAALLPQDELDTRSRHERERFVAIAETLDLGGKNVLDIGGNTGYFSFEALAAGAEVTYYEGNQAHAKFVATGRELLDLQSRLDVRNQYFLFDNAGQERYDIVLLLNVLHHVGDDYGDADISIDKARETIIESLLTMARHTKYLVFQLGFNWKGDTTLPLFPNGTKREMIEFLRDRLAESYNFDRILVADAVDERIVYADLDERNIERRDDLGEFLNRPLLFLSAKT